MIEKEDDFFEEDAVKLRAPLFFHMYIGRYSNRNRDIKSQLGQAKYV
jgi:hypothetical protein